VRIRQVNIERFRGIEHLRFTPGPCTVILGPNNASKSTVLEALDLLLHPGLGRPRPAPEEVDYFRRDPVAGFEIEAVLGNLTNPFRADVHQHLEGWRSEDAELVPEPDGEGIEPVVRVRVRGTPDFDVLHEFAKPESDGARFNPALRSQLGWIFDGRSRDPGRQLSFYQGGLLDRLFAAADLDAAIEGLRGALGEGAQSINADEAVETVLAALSTDLETLGLLRADERAAFEAGAVSRRALLQTLRLSLPATEEIAIPLVRQGRGAQRLVLVATLLRLAEATGAAPIGGFEEPEEALEPLRQGQLADMLRAIADGGGQILLVTHSPDIARCFGIDDLLLLQERAAGGGARHLLRALSPPIRQAYERQLDGAVVRGLFCRIPVLVEGPSDRAVFETFWRELLRAGDVLPLFRMSMDVVNAEGVANMPMLAAVLHEAGKTLVAWVDQDTQEALREIERLRKEEHCGALLLHDHAAERRNLEQALAWGGSLEALGRAMEAVAEDRGYTWDEQRNDLLSRCEGADPAARERAKATGSVSTFLGELEETTTRRLISSALSAKGVTPFEIKGARQARVLAETIVEEQGVPQNFAKAFRELDAWIRNGATPAAEIHMSTGG
jgi:ABC-type hemin transport system ATPase subunit